MARGAHLVSRIIGSLPAAALALWFAWLWRSPLALGVDAVQMATVVMLVEFVLVHASALLGAIVLSRQASARTKLASIAGMSLFYLVFIAAFALHARAWWPLAVLAGLIAGKAMLAFGATGDDQRHRLHSEWALAVLAYIAGATATVLLPIPRLGLTPAIVAQLQLSGSGMWVSQPHTVIAFGAFYFTMQAIVRLLDVRLPASGLHGMRE